MTTRIWLLALGLALCACGDDASNDDDDHDTKDAGGMTQKDAAMEDSGAFGNVTCNPSGSGACQNADDCPIIAEGKARGAAQMCGLACIAEADKAACSRTCVIRETSLTSGCADCYVAIVGCSFDHCVGDCASDPDSQGCFDCQVSNGCREAFDTCSGLPPVKRP